MSYKRLYPVYPARKIQGVRISKPDGGCLVSYPLPAGECINLLEVCETVEGKVAALCAQVAVERLYFQHSKTMDLEIVDVSQLPGATFRNRLVGHWDLLSLELDFSHQFKGEDHSQRVKIQGQVNHKEGTVLIPSLQLLYAVGVNVVLVGYDLLCYGVQKDSVVTA